ncbi:MAG: WD40/YVTN/BNR-like repeat-containing protein [Candidatus Nanopelagicales bacterium]
MPSPNRPPKAAAAQKRAARQDARKAAAEAAGRVKRRKRIWITVGIVTGMLAVGLIVVAAVRGNPGQDGSGTGAGAGGDSAAAPTVGGDFHTMAAIDGVLYVGGHQAVAASSDGGRTWADIPTLANADTMGWAVTPDAILAGGHPGLFRSTDGGASFTQLPIDFADVHALGAAGGIAYAASPQAGLLVSDDGGGSWEVRNGEVGRSFMGTLLVDPDDPNRIIAPDMAGGLATSTDGGSTWSPLGGPSGAMAVAWNPTDIDEVIAVGVTAGALSRDGGSTWQDLDLPAGTSAVAYSEDGATTYAGVLKGVQAYVYASTDGGATWELTS